ncbi:hypothetical protein A2U01_0076201, partial [Trifolium medium]|nr:hypothetical protein [Trifolium medium]
QHQVMLWLSELEGVPEVLPSLQRLKISRLKLTSEKLVARLPMIELRLRLEMPLHLILLIRMRWLNRLK